MILFSRVIEDVEALFDIRFCGGVCAESTCGPLSEILPSLYDKFGKIAFFLDLVLVDVLQEFDRLLHSEERVTFFSHIESVVICELLDQVHLRLQILDSCLDYDVHEYSKVLICRQVQFFRFYLYTVPKRLDGHVNCVADSCNQVQLISRREDSGQLTELFDAIVIRRLLQSLLNFFNSCHASFSTIDEL